MVQRCQKSQRNIIYTLKHVNPNLSRINPVNKTYFDRVRGKRLGQQSTINKTMTSCAILYGIESMQNKKCTKIQYKINSLKTKPKRTKEYTATDSYCLATEIYFRNL